MKQSNSRHCFSRRRRHGETPPVQDTDQDSSVTMIVISIQPVPENYDVYDVPSRWMTSTVTIPVRRSPRVGCIRKPVREGLQVEARRRRRLTASSEGMVIRERV